MSFVSWVESTCPPCSLPFHQTVHLFLPSQVTSWPFVPAPFSCPFSDLSNFSLFFFCRTSSDWIYHFIAFFLLELSSPQTSDIFIVVCTNRDGEGEEGEFGNTASLQRFVDGNIQMNLLKKLEFGGINEQIDAFYDRSWQEHSNLSMEVQARTLERGIAGARRGYYPAYIALL